jgi:hypothetical protein
MGRMPQGYVQEELRSSEELFKMDSAGKDSSGIQFVGLGWSQTDVSRGQALGKPPISRAVCPYNPRYCSVIPRDGHVRRRGNSPVIWVL